MLRMGSFLGLLGLLFGGPVAVAAALPPANFNFTRNDNECFSYVFKQPETPEEELLCKDALDNCPVEAIGKDG